MRSLKGTQKQTKSHRKLTLLLCLGSVMTALAGYLLLNRGLWTFYAFAHLGALGVMGLICGAAAHLATRKHRDYWTAFALASVVPMLARIVAVLTISFREEGRFYCGGSVCLPVALFVTFFYLFAKKKLPLQEEHAE